MSFMKTSQLLKGGIRLCHPREAFLQRKRISPSLLRIGQLQEFLPGKDLWQIQLEESLLQEDFYLPADGT